jgi:hypothetical protein
MAELEPGEERELGFRVPEEVLTDDEQEAAGGDPSTGRLIRAPEETTPLVFVRVREPELVAMPLSILRVWRRWRPDAELTVNTSLPEAAFYALSAGLAERFADVSDDPSGLAHALAAGTNSSTGGRAAFE